MAENFRNNRERKSFARKKENTREELPRVLIVTEGEVTEVAYFKAMCRHSGLNLLSVRKTGEDVGIEGKGWGSAPVSVYKYALNEFNRKEETLGKAKNAPPYWQEIYCVFDRDSHPTYHEAIQEINNVQKKHPERKFTAITSHRCFELWFLLHFKYTTKNFPCAEDLDRELKKIEYNGEKIFLDYSHGSTDIFSKINQFTDNAINHAYKLKQWAANSCKCLDDAPHTHVDKLVLRIREIAEQKRKLCKKPLKVTTQKYYK